ncbi:hypothetical protein RvY_14976 [Ramazzottius varieornatus]|uniref:N-acetylgalactosaminide beta-1,3-galactosyltransferase n=1 Tax=Ramazzottius varieornatus TaxID=947166 RepID=A0A1D1W0C1_RAMVA|nr:hypothetical protein RvY_14976 [Ramazzottius varieornatus]
MRKARSHACIHILFSFCLGFLNSAFLFFTFRVVLESILVRHTQRCNGFIFVSSQTNLSIPTIDARVGEGRESLWGKTKFGFRYVYNTSSEQYDWFLKADDDTDVIVENLRLLLTNYSSNKEVYLGYHFKEFLAEGLVFSPLRTPMIIAVLTFSGYASGGAGYVLSRKAVQRFVDDGLNKNVCRSDSGGFEDVEIGTCLVKIGITIQDTRDSYGRARFFPFNAIWHMRLSDVKRKDFQGYFKYHDGDYLDCCADTAITFHNVSAAGMYLMEHFIYRLKAYGINGYTSTRLPIQPEFLAITDTTA